MADESIFNLIPQQQGGGSGGDYNETQSGGNRYRSVHAERVQKELKSKKKSGATMGPARVDPPNQQQFLKKGNGVKKPVVEVEKTKFEATKPSVPRRHERPVMGVKSDKDFINENAIKAVTGVNKKTYDGTVLDAAGNRFKVDESGLVPKYAGKKDFGKTPEYLIRRKQEEQQQQQQYQSYKQALAENSAHQRLSDKERMDILNGLKTNWSQLHKEYLGLPMIVSNPSKIALKNRMEAQLAQLEQDIQTIERHPVIYVEKY